MHCLENSENNDFKKKIIAKCIEFLFNEFTFSYNLSFSNRKVWRHQVFIDAIFYMPAFSVKKDLDVIGLFEMKWLTHFDANIICKMTIQPVCHSNTSHALTKFFLTSHLNYLKLLFHETLFQEIFFKYSSY